MMCFDVIWCVFSNWLSAVEFYVVIFSCEIQAFKMAYQPGEIALCGQPFVYVTEFSIRSRVCEFCLEFKSDEENTLKKCAKCKLVYYCNSDCQKKSWEELHQKECKILRNFKQPYFFQPLESIGEGSSYFYAVYLTRIILKLKKIGGIVI